MNIASCASTSLSLIEVKPMSVQVSTVNPQTHFFQDLGANCVGLFSQT